MNLKYKPITKSILALIPLIAANPSLSQHDVSLKDKFATVNGTRVHYRMGGEGPFLLFLHGFTLSGGQWDPFVNDFAKHYTVIIPDLPRHGKSGPYQTDYGQWAQLMLGLLQTLGIDRVSGIGHSAGAITILLMAQQDPHILASMILISGAHRLGSEGRRLLIEDSFEKADEAFQSYYLSTHPGGLQQVEALFDDLNNMAGKYDAAAGHPVLTPETLAGIDIPALLIWGDRDPYFPLKVGGELYGSLPRAQLWVIPGQGHVPLWPAWGGDEDAAEQFVPLACRFLTRHPAEQALTK